MGTYNVSKIEGWLKDFTSAKDKFTNTYYSDYKNSYIRSCNDSAVVKMRNKLNEHYARISRINSRIKTVWDDFLWDLKVIDNRLAGGKGSANDSSVGSKLAKLPSLKEYKANLSVRINSASAVVGTVDKIGWSEDKNFWENLDNSMDVLESTAAVTATSVISGIFGLAEDLVDGALWLGTAAVTGTATLFGEEEWANNAQNKMMNAISYDVVGEANKAFYENTSLGRTINERSIIKYDSEVAQSIQNVSTKVAEFAAATALTIATGGAAAPVAALIIGGTGFLIGAGDKAQENFQQEDRNFWGDSKEVAIAGVVKAVEFYSEGQMGAGALKAIGTVKSSGGVKNLLSNMKTVLSNGESSLFTKESLKNGLKATLKDTDTYMDSIGAAFNNITYDNKNGIQVNWKGLAKETACNFALNSVFGFIGNAFETKMISGMEKMGISPSSAKNADVNAVNMKNTVDDVPKKIKIVQDITGGAAADERVLKQVDEILNIDTNNVKTVDAPLSKKNLTSAEKTDIWLEYDKLVDKVTNSGDFDNKLRFYSRGNFFEGSDEFAKDIEKIMVFEKQLGVPQSSSVIPDIAKPFEWSNDKLDIERSINAKRKPIYNYGGSASEDQFLGNQSYDFSRQGSGGYAKTVRDGNNFYINSKTFTFDDMKSINKNSRFKKTIVYVNDDIDPSIIFKEAKKPKNVIVRVGDFEYLSDGNGIRINQWRNTASVEPIKSPPVKSINQTNFEDRVGRTAAKLADDYNYLHSLKEDGTLEKLIRQGQKFDSYTGVKLTDVDATLEKYAKRIDDLQDLVFKDDVVMTSRQRNLYDAMNSSIEKLNKQFGAKYGPDIGIKQVTAYANGKVDLNYIPREYRDVIKDYSYDELQEYFLLKKQIEICNEFSKNGKMTDNYTNTFSRYVDADKIAETKNVNILLTDEAFEIFYPGSNAMAFNNGKNSYMNLKYSDDIIKANISHENIHQMSSNNGISGIRIDERHRGINETFTEYLNNLSLKSDYPKKPYCGYQPMVDRLNFLVQKGIFTNDDIMNAYFNNDISPIMNKVNRLAGSDNYYDNFVAAFQNAHDNHQYNDLDKCCMDLDYWNSRKTGQRNFGDTLDLSEITQEIPIQ